MHGHPPRAFDAEGGDFARTKALVHIHPYARQSLNAFSLNPVLPAGSDDGLFQAAHVLADVREKLFQIEDGVAYQLARTVVRDVTAAVDGVVRHPQLVEPFGRSDHVFLVARFPQGEDVRVFYEKEVVLWKVQGRVGAAVGAFKPRFSPRNFQIHCCLQQRFLLPPHRLVGLVTEVVKMNLRLHGQGICANAFFR